MFFLKPRYQKEGRQFVRDAQKLLAYKRDLLSPEVIALVEGKIAELEAALKVKDEPAVRQKMDELNLACGKVTRVRADAGWRENVEVFVVAIVIALAVRTYFLQPFTIPTGSMQPTLNGILTYPMAEPQPAMPIRFIQFWTLGRSYVDVVAQQDGEEIVNMEEISRLGNRLPFFKGTRLISNRGNTYDVWVQSDAVQKLLEGRFGRAVKAGEPLVRGYVETGDHVFVDKFSYHFFPPKRGDVFVFSTKDIRRLNPVGQPSQFYIKRLVGLPSDTLQLQPPTLLVNGQPAQEPSIQRVAQGTDAQPHEGYRGYALASIYHPSDRKYLVTPDEKLQVPEDSYVALGDNSYNSLDSRAWGFVPEQNIMGRAVFVYWPFGKHWNFIR